ncbi:hypothetical protein [Vibrio phage V-YDF132]|nr:hypothetical protein [Vibrio phage V-YDF132]
MKGAKLNSIIELVSIEVAKAKILAPDTESGRVLKDALILTREDLKEAREFYRMEDAPCQDEYVLEYLEKASQRISGVVEADETLQEDFPLYHLFVDTAKAYAVIINGLIVEW